MNLKDFSRENRKRCESPTGFKHTLESWSLSDWMTALTGEVGEAANFVKKINRIRDGIPGNSREDSSGVDLRYRFAEELADAMIYLDLITQAAGFDLSDIVIKKFNKKNREIGYKHDFPKMENTSTSSPHLECGHDMSNLGVTVETNTRYCHLCYIEERLRDAGKQEKELLHKIEKLESELFVRLSATHPLPPSGH